MDEEEAELRNPFPSPPSHYQNYTTHNLKLLSLLQERVGDGEVSQVNQYHVLSDQSDIPDWSLTQLDKPRVDWILEEGSYTVFGDTWPVSQNLCVDQDTVQLKQFLDQGGNPLTRRARRTPTVSCRSQCRSVTSIGRVYVAQFYVDRRPALQTVLKSLLYTYSRLLDALLLPPPTLSSAMDQPEWQKHVEWITIMAQNIMAAANDLRPVQVSLCLAIQMHLDEWHAVLGTGEP